MSFRSSDRFDDMPMSDATKRAIREVFRYERLSTQQALYMPLMMDPAAPDVFVKAGTGSGKTLGFLIPAIESIARRPKSVSVSSRVLVLILSPTRELAVQTAGEATRLLSFHTGLRAKSVTGGTDRAKDLRDLRTPPAILVATPGRLQDILDEEPQLLKRVITVVLDEADRLLDPGFAPAVRKILATLPASPTRRTLLLTATVPPEVKDVATTFMRPGFQIVDASGGSVNRNVGVRQVAVMCSPTCVHVELARTLARSGGKVLVFFGSIALAELFAALFRSHANPAWAGLLELHGGLAQNKRTHAMAEFKSRATAVLFASDAAGRGIDAPGVTLVVQIGSAPPDVYQQRVGRTGRAGAKGEAILLLGTDEAKALPGIRGVAPSLVTVDAAAVSAEEHRSFMIGAKDQDQAERAFKGSLGSLKANAKSLGWSSQGLVDAVAARLLGMGMERVPEISDKTLGKMGLQGVSFDTAAILRRINVKSLRASKKASKAAY